MAFEIEKGIPLQPRKHGRHSGIREVIERLEAGDSFECNYKQAEVARQIGHLRSVRLVSRKIGNDRYRVWRIA